MTTDDTSTRVTLTNAAREAVSAKLQIHNSLNNSRDVVGFVWIDAGLNNGHVESQVALGFFEPADVTDDVRRIIDGSTTIVFSVPDSFWPLFEGACIDYDGSRFRLTRGDE
jgi:hypothetical protein